MTKEFKLYNDFKNDILFKYLLHDDTDPGCIFMLKLFIENILNIKCDQVTVVNPELNPKHINDKDMILDVKVKTADGNIIDIEMQNSTFSESHYYRFCIYGATMLSLQKEKGKDYTETVHPVYQIIFIDDIDKDSLTLIDTYKSTNQKGLVEKCDLITRSYVQLPYINIIKEQKSINEMTALEKALYIFKNGLDNDIMKVPDQEVIEIMKNKIDMFNEDEILRDMYYKRDLNKVANESEKQELYEKGKAEGKKEGLVEGEKQGLAKGLVQGEKAGLAKGIIKELIDFIEARYGTVEKEWIISLNENQLKEIKRIIFEEDSYEKFKQRINSIKDN